MLLIGYNTRESESQQKRNRELEDIYRKGYYVPKLESNNAFTHAYFFIKDIRILDFRKVLNLTWQ